MQPMNDKIKGNAKTAIGKTKEVVGYAVGNKKLQAEGTTQKNEGKAQKNLGELKDKAQVTAHETGDGIKQAGRKLQEKGFEKTGRAIENAGSKIEHLAD
jgi:uncharacterized protein YjbJ (UPF0337 family)